MSTIRTLPVAFVKTVLPANFRYTLRQASEKLGITYATLYANVYRDPKEQHFLRAHQDTPGGTIKVYAWDLEDYDRRRQLKPEDQN